MADARTILAGGNLISDAYRQRIAAAAAKRERKKSAVREASEAFTGLREAFEQYGDWKTARAGERELVDFTNALKLGHSTGGLEGAMTALSTMKPSTKAGAEWLAERVDSTTEALRKQKQEETETAWEYFKEMQRQKEWKAAERWKAVARRDKLAEIKSKQEAEREAEAAADADAKWRSERTAAFRELVETGAADAEDVLDYALNRDGTTNHALLREGRMLLGIEEPEEVEPRSITLPDGRVITEGDPGWDEVEEAYGEDIARRSYPEPEEPEDGDADPVPQGYREDIRRLTDDADRLWRVYETAVGPNKLTGDYPDEDELEAAQAEEKRRRFLYAAQRANIRALQAKRTLPYNLPAIFEEGDLEWLGQQDFSDLQRR